jgi:hypothetical protein
MSNEAGEIIIRSMRDAPTVTDATTSVALVAPTVPTLQRLLQER